MSDRHGAGSGARLRLARQARGYSQQQMADMAGVTRQAITAVESGQSDPSLRTALALAHALGMTVEELFGSATPVLSVAARPVAPLGDEGARVTLAPMGEGYRRAAPAGRHGEPGRVPPGGRAGRRRGQ